MISKPALLVGASCAAVCPDFIFRDRGTLVLDQRASWHMSECGTVESRAGSVSQRRNAHRASSGVEVAVGRADIERARPLPPVGLEPARLVTPVVTAVAPVISTPVNSSKISNYCRGRRPQALKYPAELGAGAVSARAWEIRSLNGEHTAAAIGPRPRTRGRPCILRSNSLLGSLQACGLCGGRGGGRACTPPSKRTFER